ncbi:ATP-dependent DNA helicase PIF4 [Glycine soja]
MCSLHNNLYNDFEDASSTSTRVANSEMHDNSLVREHANDPLQQTDEGYLDDNTEIGGNVDSLLHDDNHLGDDGDECAHDISTGYIDLGDPSKTCPYCHTAMCSLGAKIDTSVLNGKGPSIYKIHGQSCHLIVSLLPMPEKPPKFAQLYIYDTENEIQNRIDANDDGTTKQVVDEIKHYLDGRGTGKTFMWKTLSDTLRSKGDIVLTVASSGIASLLLPNGRTAHSKFVILVPTLENSTCNIHQGIEQARLLKATKLIIWDEAPMAHKYCFEALDKTLNDFMLMSNSDSVPFGGKVVVFGGDFKQIFPIITRGSRSDIVNATINASYLWDYCTVLKLTKKMHLQSNLTITNAQEIKRFSQWLIDVGEGKLEISNELLIKNFNDHIELIVGHTYPYIQHNYKDEEFLKSRAILASTNEIVDQINDYILNIISGDEKEYLSCDSIDITDVASSESHEAVTPEFLHSFKTSGMPNHKIRIKIGTPIMLIQNLDQVEGL